ncbi:MAG: tail fiber domain-containing protein [Ferruginibacter sp.]
MKHSFLLCILCMVIAPFYIEAQNVGIGTTTPLGKLHIKGTQDTSQLVIQAFTTQSPNKPLVSFLAADGSSLLALHSFNDNIYLGKNNGTGTTTGYKNIYLGKDAGASTTTGYFNYLIGDEAGKSISNGYENIGIGQRVMQQVTSGNGNVCLGSNVLANGTGTATSFNTAVGSHALYSGGGNSNTALGFWSMGNSTAAATNNVAIGIYSLFGNINSGSSNTAAGNYSLYYNTSGSNNSAIGAYSMFKNNGGGSNAALGFQSLYTNISGVQNVAIGYNSAFSNIGSYNTAVGSQAMIGNSTGTSNVAVGYLSMPGATDGSFNTAVGVNALRTPGAQYNTAVGYLAGYNYNNGYNNVFVGSNTDVNGTGYFNVIAIGQGTIVGGSSTARFGNSSTVSYGGWAGWTNVSDGRFKTSVQENVPGISFITALRPVTYHLQAKALDEFQHQGIKNELSEPAIAVMNKAFADKEKITYTGFIAQEVEAAADKAGYNFSGVDKPKSETDVYGLRYAEFVVPLVKAVQEQQDIITAQRKKIDDLESAMKALKKEMNFLLKN